VGAGKNILKPTIGNVSFKEISNNNGVTAVNFTTSKYLTVKSTMLSYHITNLLALLMEICTIKLTTFLYKGDYIQVHFMSGHSG
jgi:hypothetical protein